MEVLAAEREHSTSRASYAYSDSESDLPMLRAVGHPVVVNPDAALRAIAPREGWEIIELDPLGRRLRMAGALGAAGALIAGAAAAARGRRASA